MNKSRTPILGILVAALTLALPLCAAETKPAATPAAPAGPLSLQECIAIAQQNQIDVLVGQNAVTSSLARTTQARSSFYPQVSIEATPFVQSGVTGGGHSTGPNEGTAITLSQNFYDGGLREAQVKAARFGETQSAASLARTRQSVTFNVTSAYYNALRAQHLAGVADAQVQYAQGQEELVHARVQAGDAAQVDELPVLAQLANAKVQQLAAKNTVRTSLIQLQNAMGLSSRTEFAIRDVEAPAPLDLQPQEHYITLAQEKRPDVQAQNAAVGGAQSTLKSAKLQTQPRIVASGQYGLGITGSTSSDWSVSAGIAYDLFDGGKNRAVVDQEKANLTSTQQQAKQLGKDIEADVQQAYLNLVNANERMAASAVSLDAAQKNMDAQNARYKEGLATPLDLLNAQVAL
ncbi:MAG TPA: TolC family protein, partial [Armatimonadota bacterium]